MAAIRLRDFPPGLSDIAARVEGRVLAFLDHECVAWSEIDPGLEEPFDSLRALVAAGGKRLRPAFCFAAFIGVGGDPDSEAVVDAGAALELVHTFALVHDDVMDGSLTRRGAAAVHQRFVLRHLEAGWQGEARRFGEGMAILVGDLALVEADRLLRGAPAAAWEVWDQLRLELCIGQSLDLVGAARRRFDLDDARRIAVFKSALYTVERPLHLGAALRDASEALVEPLSRIGRPLGEAFQLRDDLLGVFGDPEATGKPVGDDLREGKPTPLAAIARARCDAAGRELLERVGASDLSDSEVETLQDMFVSSGAVAQIEVEIDALVARAHDSIDAATLVDPAGELLHGLAEYVAWRDR